MSYIENLTIMSCSGLRTKLESNMMYYTVFKYCFRLFLRTAAIFSGVCNGTTLKKGARI